MCRTCIDKLVRPEMRDPLTNVPVQEKDIILMKAGGTLIYLSLYEILPFIKVLDSPAVKTKSLLQQSLM